MKVAFVRNAIGTNLTCAVCSASGDEPARRLSCSVPLPETNAPWPAESLEATTGIVIVDVPVGSTPASPPKLETVVHAVWNVFFCAIVHVAEMFERLGPEFSMVAVSVTLAPPTVSEFEVRVSAPMLTSEAGLLS